MFTFGEPNEEDIRGDFDGSFMVVYRPQRNIKTVCRLLFPFLSKI